MSLEQSIRLCLVSIALAGLNGCSSEEQQKSQMIKGMIQGGMSSKTSVMSNAQGIFKDYKVYQDGTSDGVVFEYIYADDVEIDESQLSEDNIKQQMVAAMGADPNVREVLGKGIYMKMVYTRGDGTVIGECRITSADL